MHITFPSGTIEAERGVSAGDVIARFNLGTAPAQAENQSSAHHSLKCHSENRILAARVNNEICPLDMPMTVNAHVEPIMAKSRTGNRVYRRSMCLLLAAAAHNIFPDARLLCGHSISYGYYYTLETGGQIADCTVKSLEEQMQDMVKRAVAFKSALFSYADAMNLFDKLQLTQAKEHIKYMASATVVLNCVLGEDGKIIFSDFSFGPLVPNASYLSAFALKPYSKGFVLRLPKAGEAGKLPPFVDQPTLSEVYSKYKDWGRRVGVSNAADLNALVTGGKISDFVQICENFQNRQFSDAADKIVSRKDVRVVLLAGPSSSGKTTSAKRLALDLQSLGFSAKVISFDCYYVGRDKTPKDINGNPDFECLEALDIDLVNKNLLDLFAGKEVNIPSYSFAAGSRYYEAKNKMTLGQNDILIMEGIHALNDKLTVRVPREKKFKLYISPFAQINLDDHNRVSTSDNRLIRRIVRDNQFRSKDAAGTIAMWPSVRRGETLHIFPFQDSADAILNTALDYEFSVLKVYAVPLLRCVNPQQTEYSEARRLLDFLDNFAEVDSSAVPPRSILREFIGGSAFSY